jgi:hypothetical protein
MATTPVSAAGGDACPWEFSPQPTMVPSLFKAKLWLKPQAMATTPVNPAGGVASP